MDKQTAIQRALHFFLTKIVIGLAVIGGLVALVEWLGNVSLDKTLLSDNAKNTIIAFSDSIIAVLSYMLLFKSYEKRQIKELSASVFGKNAIIGFLTGLILQSLFIAVIYLAGTYSVIHINPVSTLIVPFAFALQAGFVAEILLIGVLFRITEEQVGTVIALTLFILLFAILHLNAKGATFLSVCATAMQAGFMLPAAYVFSRNLWLPIFLHFGWDFAEPGIFGGINPGISITQRLFAGKFAGSALVTGGHAGPQNSLQSLMFCLLMGALFLLLTKRKNNFIKPKWQVTATDVSIASVAEH